MVYRLFRLFIVYRYLEVCTKLPHPSESGLTAHLYKIDFFVFIMQRNDSKMLGPSNTYFVCISDICTCSPSFYTESE